MSSVTLPWAQEVLIAIMIRKIHLQIYLRVQFILFTVIDRERLVCLLVVGKSSIKEAHV